MSELEKFWKAAGKAIASDEGLKEFWHMFLQLWEQNWFAFAFFYSIMALIIILMMLGVI